MHDQLAKLGIGVRISNSHLLAGQSSKQLNDRRQQAVVIVPLLTPKWVADHRETHWPAAAQLVPVCVTAMRTKIENGKILLADNAPMQVFQGGKPWPNRAGGNETFTEELADQLVARVKESYQQLQRQGMARRVELDDVTTVDHEAVQIGLTDASSRSLGNATPRHDRTEAVHVVDHLEAWAAASEGKPYAVLLGDSGSGKTTAAQVLNNRLNATYRKHLEHQGADRADARLSIYLDLRKADLDERQSPELERLINNVMERTWEEEAARTITPDVILDQVRNHGAVLIFDGLDEVLVRVNEQRGMEFIQQLWRALPPEMVKDDDRNTGRLVMTCRTHYFPTLDSERSFFGGQDRTDGVPTMYEALHLLPFNEAQIRDYLSQHFRKRDEHQPGLGQVDAAMTMLADVHNLLEARRTALQPAVDLATTRQPREHPCQRRNGQSGNALRRLRPRLVVARRHQTRPAARRQTHPHGRPRWKAVARFHSLDVPQGPLQLVDDAVEREHRPGPLVCRRAAPI